MQVGRVQCLDNKKPPHYAGACRLLHHILLQLLRLYWQYKLHPERGAFVFDAKIGADFGIVFIFD